MDNEAIREQQRKKWLIKILLFCGRRNRCKGCGCRLPGKKCCTASALNSEDIEGMKAIYRRMRGGGDSVHTEKDGGQAAEK